MDEFQAKGQGKCPHRAPALCQQTRSLTPALPEIPQCPLFQQIHTTARPEGSRWCLFPLPQHLPLYDLSSSVLTHKCITHKFASLLGVGINNWFFLILFFFHLKQKYCCRLIDAANAIKLDLLNEIGIFIIHLIMVKDLFGVYSSPKSKEKKRNIFA